MIWKGTISPLDLSLTPTFQPEDHNHLVTEISCSGETYITVCDYVSWCTFVCVIGDGDVDLKADITPGISVAVRGLTNCTIFTILRQFRDRYYHTREILELNLMTTILKL